MNKNYYFSQINSTEELDEWNFTHILKNIQFRNILRSLFCNIYLFWSFIEVQQHIIIASDSELRVYGKK